MVWGVWFLEQFFTVVIVEFSFCEFGVILDLDSAFIMFLMVPSL